MSYFYKFIFNISLLISFSVPFIENFAQEDFIRYMEFELPYEALERAYRYDIESHSTEYPLDWVELLAFAVAKNWGNIDSKIKGNMDEAVHLIRDGQLMQDISKSLKLYDYYFTTFSAVLAGFLGEYEVVENGVTTKQYGLKAFSPIAKGHSFEHFNDFGNPRSYGYKRRHLGHDIFGATGTPIIAVEDGVVEALGWNRFGGWRIGIRSIDSKRYYYYAHLRKDRPYAKGLSIGQHVQSGDVIGYLGATGYSTKENVSNIDVPHLHFGLQIIFDESQKDSVNQVWIDCYSITKFLNKNRMTVIKTQDNEYIRSVEINNHPID